jgi:putative PIN family toxin of toxin-antitoxin system
MIRVVLDTNIIVSALLQPLGAPAQVFILAIGSVVQVCLTGNLYAEYEEVLSRPKFRIGEDTIAAALRDLREKALWVRSTETVHACCDPADDMFVECAAAANAQYLVTGNLKHFPPAWAGTRVVTARWLMDNIARIATPEDPER